MIKIFLIYLTIFLGLSSSVNSIGNILDCQFKTGTCSSDEQALFYANSQVGDSLGNVINSPVSKNYDVTNYNRALCCKINSPNLENLVAQTESFDRTVQGMNCANGGEDLMYFTSSTNAKVGFPNSSNFNISFFNQKLCVKLPDELSSLDILVSDDINYKNIGYSCLYKTKLLDTNGVVSSCDATYTDEFNNQVNYPYTVWGKLFENIESLKCNSDCTSKLDNRVYSACSQKVSGCEGIPFQCDGSLLSGWVNYNETHQVQCSSPWDVYKKNIFTSKKIEVKSNDDKCSNLIKKKYSVILDNQQVYMSVYVCGN